MAPLPTGRIAVAVEIPFLCGRMWENIIRRKKSVPHFQQPVIAMVRSNQPLPHVDLSEALLGQPPGFLRFESMTLEAMKPDTSSPLFHS